MPNSLGAFSELLEREASAHEFAAWFRECPDGPPLSKADWQDLVLPVANAAGGFEWLARRDRAWVEGCLLDFIRNAFTKLWKPTEHGYGVSPESSTLARWLESLPDEDLADFCWKMLQYERLGTPRPVLWLHHSGRLAGAISLANIELALVLADESNRMFSWPEERWSVAAWERDSQTYSALMPHSSHLVRAGASAALGSVYHGLKTKVSMESAPPASEILAMIQTLEIHTPGVAGAFLHGARWWCSDDWDELSAGFDMRAWVLETLRNSEREPEVPEFISLEFFAHEMFARDAEAIREMLLMGRRYLAVLTATEAPDAVSQLMPLLRAMATSSDAAISAAITEYLAAPSTHAGLHHMDRRADTAIGSV